MATLEKLRVYKKVCLKIRSSLVSGREDLVSPTLVTRNFVEGFTASLNDPILSKQSLDSKIREEEEEEERESRGYRSSGSYGNGASANCGGDGEGGERRGWVPPQCPFIEPAEGWSTEYYETRCQVRDRHQLHTYTSVFPLSSLSLSLLLLVVLLVPCAECASVPIVTTTHA